MNTDDKREPKPGIIIDAEKYVALLPHTSETAFGIYQFGIAQDWNEMHSEWNYDFDWQRKKERPNDYVHYGQDSLNMLEKMSLPLNISYRFERH